MTDSEKLDLILARLDELQGKSLKEEPPKHQPIPQKIHGKPAPGQFAQRMLLLQQRRLNNEKRNP